MPISRAMRMISTLSMPIRGRSTGRVRHVLRDAQGLHGLAGHLPQDLAGDQARSAVGLPGDGFGHAHHEAAHDEGEVLLRALVGGFPPGFR